MKPGLYEKAINKQLEQQLQQLPEHFDINKEKLDVAELPALFAKLLEERGRKSFDRIKKTSDKSKVLRQIELFNELMAKMAELTEDDEFTESQIKIDEKPEMLLGILDKQQAPAKTAKDLVRPTTALTNCALFTGSKAEPSLGSEIKKEIQTADEIAILMSFIRWTGLRIILSELEDFTKNGGKLRVITTSYMGATEYKAIEYLAKLPNAEIKVSYDTKRTRLHAKAYIFKRKSGFSTAYIGSSNISESAMSAGLEWNTKITESDFADIYEQCCGRFDTYWEDGEFVSFHPNDEDKAKMLRDALLSEGKGNKENRIKYFVNIKPYPYQQDILAELSAQRELHNNYRNLVVAATGTGKTMISAFDYKNYCERNPQKKNRLLFVAHRQEILEQSLEAFQFVLRDNNFGELLTGNHKASEYDHLFITIQSFNSKSFDEVVAQDFYDFIIVDELHHYAAPTYLKPLAHFSPDILLGLTATPERTDGKDQEIMETYFNGIISAEIRLPEAIHRRLLVPFQYFGVTDCVDYSGLKWVRGGYEKSALEKALLDGNHQRCHLILKAVDKYVTNMHKMRALGFCVSKQHAEYMANYFNEQGLPADFLHSDCSEEKRNAIQNRLKQRKINIIFVVDIYNEGVDIPFLDTVLFLRPTESLTVFLQQLGRGLRIDDEKECLTVLDFVGQAHKNYAFEQRFRALLGTTSHSIEGEIENDFPHIPSGCSIHLEKKAKEYILNNVKKYFTGGGGKFVARMKTFEQDSGKPLTLANFLEFYNLPVGQIYKNNTWSHLMAKAGKITAFDPKDKDIKFITTGLRRVCHINSWKYLHFLLNNWDKLATVDYETLPKIEQQYIRMFYYSLWQHPLAEHGFDGVHESFQQLNKYPQFVQEIKELLTYNLSKIRFVERPNHLAYPLALEVHDVYTRDEVMAAFAHYTLEKKPSMREGVIYFKSHNTDVFFVTLNKSEKDYSATTMYKDYALSEKLFHWQSQSTTSVDGKVGQRYINHTELGNDILLFVREKKVDENGLVMPYHFLGKVQYQDHYGSKPINFMWELHEPMPAYILEQNRRLG